MGAVPVPALSRPNFQWSYFRFRLRELRLKLWGLLAHVQPVKKCIGGLEPDAKPVRNFQFLGALVGFDFCVARDHFRATLPQARYVQDALDRGAFAMRLDFPPQL